MDSAEQEQNNYRMPGKKEEIKKEEKKVNVTPTEGQRQAGNYKKGHVRIDGHDISIEQPKGSVRRGKDADGKEWEQKMNNTYGYIRGTESVDGDHIDVFLSDDPEKGDVYVVDQINRDGSFDEHKVMYGFSSEEEAKRAYLSNYEKGWKGLGQVTHMTKEEFKDWINSSRRKTKPASEYFYVFKNRQPVSDAQVGSPVSHDDSRVATNAGVTTPSGVNSSADYEYKSINLLGDGGENIVNSVETKKAAVLSYYPALYAEIPTNFGFILVVKIQIILILAKGEIINLTKDCHLVLSGP